MRTEKQAQRSDWHALSVKELRQELDQVIALGMDIPSEPGGWWHQYVCPEHHTELLFDPLEPDAAVYQCPYGCQLSGEPYRGAWLVFKHQAMARYALQAAAVYANTGEAAYAELGVSIIVRYAEQFPHYPVHPEAQPWMLKGRAFHQALTEAIWATTLLRAYLLLADEGVKLQRDQEAAFEQFLMMLESSMVEYHRILTFERGNPENNYTAWLNAALSCVYAVRGQGNKLQQLIESEGGFRHHLSIGVKPDHLEFEGSIYYHLFVLRAYLIAAQMAERFSIDLYSMQGEHGQHLQGMLDVLLPFADRSGYLAALHDGPYARAPFAREIAEIVEIGLAKYGKPEYVPLLAQAYRELYGSPQRYGLEAVVFGSGEWDMTRPNDSSASVLLEDSGFAVLKQPMNELSCLIDFGPHGGSHGHYDKLNLMLNGPDSPLAPDRGTVPYGSVLKKMWYPLTACHNTISVAGRTQQQAEGNVLRFEGADHYSYGWFSTQQAYDGCRLDRHLYVTADFVVDWFTVAMNEEAGSKPVQWWFHALGELVTLRESGSDDPWSSCESQPADGDGYALIDWLKQRQAVDQGASEQLLFRQEGGACLAVTLLLSQGSSLYQVQSPGTANDPSRPMAGLMHEQSGSQLSFIAAYRYGDQPIELSWDEQRQDTLHVHKQGEAKHYRLSLTDNGLQEGKTA